MKKSDWYNLRKTEEFQELVKELQVKADYYSTELVTGAALHRDIDKPGGAAWTVGVMYGLNLFFNPEVEDEA